MARRPAIPRRTQTAPKQAGLLDPETVQVFQHGLRLHQHGQLLQAKAAYEQVLARYPGYFDALHLLGVIAAQTQNPELAQELIGKALKINPNSAIAYYNRGNALKELNRAEEALASYDKAIALKPDYADALNNRGVVLQDLNRMEDSLASFDMAMAHKPDYDFLLGNKLHTQMQLCDWRDLQNLLQKLKASIEAEQKVAPPFTVLGLTDSPGLHLKATRLYVHLNHPAPAVQSKFKTRPADGKIRIGYYSADFHNHATSYLMAELFESHDTQRFELFGFSFGPDKQDEMRSRVSGGFNHFFDVSGKSAREVAQMSRDLSIDIAVDLKGLTQDSRLEVFAEQCAPIQINYLGYPGTLAASYFDYIVADKTLIPQESQQYYSEKIIYLPHSYQVNDSKRKISDRVYTRRELGLPETGFVFCCFNKNYKILPETFDVWMRLLKTIDGSVLWLFQSSPTAARHLREHAQHRGIHPARLVFAPHMKLEEHLARHRAADLFLDTLPCNAHTTASDALWAGLPVLTQMGHSFAARVAASLLKTMNLPELITKTQEEYEARAIELATDSFQLGVIKKKLAQNRHTSPLFNGKLFTRHIEAAYSEIHRRRLSGEKPDHIEVEALLK